QLLAKSDAGRYTIAEAGSPTADLFATIRSLPASGVVYGLATLVAGLVAIAVASNRRRAAIRVGLAIAAGAAVSVVVVAVGLELALKASNSAVEARVGKGIADTLSTDFAEQQRGTVLGGFALAAVGLVLGRRPAAVALRSLPRALWTRDRIGAASAVGDLIGDNPAMARIIAWTASALVLIAWPDPTTRVLVTVIVVTALSLATIWLFTSSRRWARSGRRWLGAADPSALTANTADAGHLGRVNLAVLILAIFLLWPGWDRPTVTTFFLILSLIQVAIDVPAARRFARADAVPDPAPEQETGRSYAVLGLAVAAVVVGAVALTLISSDVVRADGGCNGHPDLCDRSVDELVWAGSHNSMSSVDLGWELAAQRGSMVDQLDHGVRVLLIDTHYWDGSGAFEGGDDPAAAAVIEEAVSDDRPRPGTWLCHGPCALGANELAETFFEIDLWLDEHPRDVVIFIVQDEITTEDTLTAFDESGLSERVHNHEPGTPWPTLEQLIELDERLWSSPRTRAPPTPGTRTPGRTTSSIRRSASRSAVSSPAAPAGAAPTMTSSSSTTG
ncbi:MAG: hypothetical protein ACR2QK_02635, partial [Acidimicrobiales bacterium]